MKDKNATGRRLAAGILTIFLLLCCLVVTTYALVMATITVENNLFQTGRVAINLNDGKQVIEEHEFLFEPGMTVVKSFFVENRGTWEVYYRIYFDEVYGGLANVLEISIAHGDQILFSGTAATLERADVQAADGRLAVGERRELTITFHYPEEAGNQTQNQTLAFNLCAQAVQTKNNPGKLFD